MEIDRRQVLRLTAAGALGSALGGVGAGTGAWAAASRAGRGTDRDGGGPLLSVSSEPSAAWQLQEVPVLETVRTNAVAVAQAGRLHFTTTPQPLTPLTAAEVAQWRATGQWDKLMRFFLPDMGPLNGGDTVNSVEVYRSLFATPGVTLPWVADSFETDATFAEMFVAGPDPTQLSRLDAVPAKFPLTDEHLHSVPALGTDSLATAMRAGRVYWLDLAVTEGLAAGKQYGVTQKYMYAPMAAFCVPADGGAPLPFAIQCGQDPAGRTVYTPRDGYSWMLARNTVLVAHMTVYEALTHLGQAHLVMDAIIKAAVRTLPAAHPVARLLVHHFEGTDFINSQVPVSLVAAGGLVDRASAVTMESLGPWVAEKMRAFSFTGGYLPNRLARASTGDARALPYYPFRDDGLLIWQAIARWAAEFTGAFYPSDAAVAADKSLQSFAAAVALTDFGRDPGSVTDRQDLPDILTMTMWTAGPFHAAVNFSQIDWMFLPAGPLAGYTPEPRGKAHTRQDWLDNFPSADVAMQHIGIGHALTGARTTVFGDYGSEFTLTPAASGVTRLASDLADAEETIRSRNKTRKQPYPYLSPSAIPNSIEI